MKNVVTITDINYGSSFENKNGIKTTIINLSLFEKLPQFKEDDENGGKVYREIKSYGINLSDFLRLFILDENLPYIDERRVDDSVTDPSERFKIKYHYHIKCMKGAKLTIEREEIEGIIYSDVIAKDDKGKDIVDKETGEVQFEPKRDEKGNIVKKLVGFGDTKFVKLELTKRGSELALKYSEIEDNE